MPPSESTGPRRAALAIGRPLANADFQPMQSWRGCGDGRISQKPTKDLDDLRRCLLLIGHMPEWRPRIDEMAAASPQWNQIAHAWSDIEAAYDAEAPNYDNPAPRAAVLLSAVIARGDAIENRGAAQG